MNQWDFYMLQHIGSFCVQKKLFLFLRIFTVFSSPFFLCILSHFLLKKGNVVIGMRASEIIRLCISHSVWLFTFLLLLISQICVCLWLEDSQAHYHMTQTQRHQIMQTYTHKSLLEFNSNVTHKLIHVVRLQANVNKWVNEWPGRTLSTFCYDIIFMCQ